jgi:hypothetical protein
MSETLHPVNDSIYNAPKSGGLKYADRAVPEPRCTYSPKG